MATPPAGVCVTCRPAAMASEHGQPDSNSTTARRTASAVLAGLGYATANPVRARSLRHPAHSRASFRLHGPMWPSSI
jgi:hypothetical protein